MKKTFIALALAASVAPAWAAEVVSSNVVGYNKVTLTSGYNMLGSNFKLIGGENGTLTEVLDATALDGLDVDSGEFAAEILIWDGVGYDTYGWAGVVGDESMDNKWVDEGSWDAVSIPAPSGSAFWIQTTSSKDIVFSGEVDSSAEVDISVGAGYTMVGNPFPKTISIQAITSDDLPGLDVDSGEFSAEILIWDGVGYDTYGWAGVVGDASMDNKWVDEGSWDAVDNVFLEIGKGCWIKSSADATLKFTK